MQHSWKRTDVNNVILLNSYSKRYKKLIDGIHNDHLKNLSTYPLTVANAQKLMLNHSSVVVVKTKQCNSEVAFGQTTDGARLGYGQQRGSCHIYKGKEEGHHSWECSARIKARFEETKKKYNEEKSSISDTLSILTSVGTGSVKKELLHAMSGIETGANYDSDHEVFDLFFCTVETMIVPARIIDGNELNIKGLEDIFG